MNGAGRSVAQSLQEVVGAGAVLRRVHDPGRRSAGALGELRGEVGADPDSAALEHGGDRGDHAFRSAFATLLAQPGIVVRARSFQRSQDASYPAQDVVGPGGRGCPAGC